MPSSSDPRVPAIRCQGVGVYFPPPSGFFLNRHARQGFWALKDLTFELDRGDILGLVGANGAGKSTALAAISRIISPNRGTIDTFGHSTMLLSINAGLSPNLSGRKNIILTGLTLGIPKRVIDEKMDEIIDFSGIGDFIDKPVVTYSTGMKSRLGFSTGLYLEPEIFLIDEALGVGDQDFKKKSSEALRKKLSGNVTAIIVSHSERTIKDLCTKALFMDQGTGTLLGTPDEVFQAYNASN